jgi:hypothetical protein
MTSLYKQDYVLLIMNCKRYRPKAIMQKNTWLKILPSYLKYYHVIGDPDLDTKCGFLFDENERILYVKTKDDYISLPHKVISAYEAIEKTFEYKYIFKTDDDQTLSNIRFFDMVKGMIEKLDPKVHYGGNVVDVKQAYLSKYHTIHPELPENLPILPIKYCSGRFYFLSKEATNMLLKKKIEIAKEYLEDYAIGLYLIDSFKDNVLNVYSGQFLNDMF